MRLVIEYVVGDGCTYHCTNTTPIEYESAEAFAVEFEEACRVNLLNTRWPLQNFTFAGKEWDVSDFYFDGIYIAPEIFTVDEWFKKR